MIDYIKRADALEAVNCKNLNKGIVDALQSLIMDIPAADVQEVKHGRWIKFDNPSYDPLDDSEPVLYFCSECDADSEAETEYCHYCGAKMDEVSE